MKQNKEEMIDELFTTILQLQNKDDCKIFFEDLCTYKEIEQMAQRICAAKLLLSDNTYNQVIAKTEISSTTLSRVSRCIQHGSGGYLKFLKKK